MSKTRRILRNIFVKTRRKRKKDQLVDNRNFLEMQYYKTQSPELKTEIGAAIETLENLIKIRDDF